MTMNMCAKLPLYLYDEMSEEESLEFRRHLANCHRCRLDLISFERIKNLKPLQNAPLPIIEAVLNKTSRKKKTDFTRALLKTTIMAISIGLLVSFIAIPRNHNHGIVRSLDGNYDKTLINYDYLCQIASNIREFESLNTLY